MQVSTCFFIKIIYEIVIPKTLLPGIASIIPSTCNFSKGLNNEIMELKSNYGMHEKIITMTIIKLKQLSNAISGLYKSSTINFNRLIKLVLCFETNYF
jgi:hypothetical protein